MRPFPFFLSVVVVVRNQKEALAQRLDQLGRHVSALVDNYELVVVDNGSSDASVAELEGLTAEDGQPDLQIYALNKPVERDAAAWVGVEHALGDYVVILGLDEVRALAGDAEAGRRGQLRGEALQEMLGRAANGYEVVFAHNARKEQLPWTYALARKGFHRLYALFNGVHLAQQAPPFRLLSKRIINFILQHPHPSLTYRHLPATGGFAATDVDYEAPRGRGERPNLIAAINRGVRLLVSTTRAPLRLVTFLCAFGALANLAYSVYVVLVVLFKADVAPGWTSSSLQQSGMFFLLSLVLLVLSEYVMHMAALSGQGPEAYVKSEFTSTHIRAQQRLNVRTVTPPFVGNVDAPRPSEFV